MRSHSDSDIIYFPKYQFAEITSHKVFKKDLRITIAKKLFNSFPT